MAAPRHSKKERAKLPGLRHNPVELLERTTSWFLCSCILIFLFALSAIILLAIHWFIPESAFLNEQHVPWLVMGSLGLIIATNVHTLRHQRRLRGLRNRLVEQMDAATKHVVRAERIYEMSIVDPLTGLYNRRFGDKRLREEIARAERLNTPLLVMALDLNYFKEINDGYGHAVGDLALKTFARRLQRAIRACDVPIRLGGDEFLVVLPECPASEVPTILSRLDRIELTLDSQVIRISFSHGVAQYQIKDTPEEMIKRADERLYAAKATRVSLESV